MKKKLWIIATALIVIAAAVLFAVPALAADKAEAKAKEFLKLFYTVENSKSNIYTEVLEAYDLSDKQIIGEGSVVPSTQYSFNYIKVEKVILDRYDGFVTDSLYSELVANRAFTEVAEAAYKADVTTSCKKIELTAISSSEDSKVYDFSVVVTITKADGKTYDKVFKGQLSMVKTRDAWMLSTFYVDKTFEL